MADSEVTTKAETDKAVGAQMDLLKAWDILRFLSKSVSDGNIFESGEIEGLGFLLEHCGNLLWPAIDALASLPKEVRHA
ncbi:hypothetical protein [Fundidesulfovibrio putealis]|uniref:hypothetical protein n=1 Tax=Fundidesulfovibrio putealis TaxID=270496 RepID=UPI00048307BD|nr:hypothetical protein [Fundidesulfovibrio putealis]